MVLAIYLNSAGFGGAEMLLLRFCAFLRQENIDHYVVDSPDSFFGRELERSGTVVIRMDNRGPQATHFFVPYSAMLREAIAWASFLPQAKVLAWIISPNESFVPNYPLVGTILRHLGYRGAYIWTRVLWMHRRHVVALIGTLREGCGLLLMDGATRRVTDYILGGSAALSISTLPIPAPIEKSPRVKRVNTDGLNVGYFGRVEDFKFSALKGFISSSLAEHAKYESVTLHLVGTGPRIEDVRRVCLTAGISLVEHGFLDNESARSVLIANCDLGAAMGTAALDLAGSGLTTIVIDPSLRSDYLSQRKFRFVSEIEDYTLGEYRDFPGYVAGKHTFPEVVNIIRSNKELAGAGKEYVKNNHDPRLIFEALLNYISCSSVCVHQVQHSAEKITRRIDIARTLYS